MWNLGKNIWKVKVKIYEKSKSKYMKSQSQNIWKVKVKIYEKSRIYEKLKQKVKKNKQKKKKNCFY